MSLKIYETVLFAVGEDVYSPKSRILALRKQTIYICLFCSAELYETRIEHVKQITTILSTPILLSSAVFNTQLSIHHYVILKVPKAASDFRFGRLQGPPTAHCSPNYAIPPAHLYRRARDANANLP